MIEKLSPADAESIRASIERMADAAHEFIEQHAANQDDHETNLEQS